MTAGTAIAAAPPRVQSAQGTVEGLRVNSIDEFLGIPYAVPPVGDLRWRPPVAAKPWTGVRQATQFGPACAQVTTLGVFAGPANVNEDCLTLNVFTPDIGTSDTLPVLVWLHGGGNMDGSSRDYDASRLASLGKIVVVTINYRLGLLGWLANPALDAEGHPFADYGLLDQQLALKWVKGNIAAFGGDPGKVTLGGQSAGSIDTEANVASPMATGLFQRAIFQSVVLDGIPLRAAEKTGADFADAAGCGRGATPEVAACLRRLPAQRIMQLSGRNPLRGPYISILIADGQIVPSSGLFAAFKSGAFTHMPIMSGTVHDEYNFLAAIAEYFSGLPRHAITAAQFHNFVTSNYPTETAKKVFSEYKLADYATPQRAWNAAGTDGLVCPQLTLNRILASQVPTYGYEFNDATAPFYFPAMPGFEPARLSHGRYPVSLPALAWRPCRPRPPAERATATSFRCLGEGLDEFRANWRPERTRGAQMAGLPADGGQAWPLSLRNPSCLGNHHGSGILRRTQVRLLGQHTRAVADAIDRIAFGLSCLF